MNSSRKPETRLRSSWTSGLASSSVTLCMGKPPRDSRGDAPDGGLETVRPCRLLSARPAPLASRRFPVILRFGQNDRMKDCRSKSSNLGRLYTGTRRQRQCRLRGWRGWAEAEGNLALQAGVVAQDASALRSQGFQNAVGSASPSIVANQVTSCGRAFRGAVINPFFVPFGQRQRNDLARLWIEHRHQKVPARKRECGDVTRLHPLAHLICRTMDPVLSCKMVLARQSPQAYAYDHPAHESTTERNCHDRPLHLDNAQRPQGFRHARRVRPPIFGPSGKYPGERTVQARVRRDLPEQQDSRDRRPRRKQSLHLRIGRHPDSSGGEDRQALAEDRLGPREGDRMADVADGEYRPDAGAGESFPERRAREDSLRDQSLCHRMHAAVQGDG